MSGVPVVDLAPWFEGDEADRRRVAERVDDALSDIGFMLVTGHGVPTELRAQVRTAAKRFFALPQEAKRPYAVTVGGRGWLPPGVEANGYAEGTATPADLKETFATGADQPTGDPEVDADWFLPNVYPAEVPELEGLVVEYLARMRTLADQLLDLCAAALGLRTDFFTAHTGHASHTLNINWYPALSHLRARIDPGQFRIGPHTDFGTVTILDRERGVSGLQVWSEADGWLDAPFVEDSFTINIGDLLARWTGDRWRSNRHRVPPPDPSAPDEELVSLIYFYECDPDTQVESLPAPIGKVAYEPVRARDYLMDKLRAITIA